MIIYKRNIYWNFIYIKRFIHSSLTQIFPWSDAIRVPIKNWEKDIFDFHVIKDVKMICNLNAFIFHVQCLYLARRNLCFKYSNFLLHIFCLELTRFLTIYLKTRKKLYILQEKIYTEILKEYTEYLTRYELIIN